MSAVYSGSEQNFRLPSDGQHDVAQLERVNVCCAMRAGVAIANLSQMSDVVSRVLDLRCVVAHSINRHLIRTNRPTLDPSVSPGCPVNPGETFLHYFSPGMRFTGHTEVNFKEHSMYFKYLSEQYVVHAAPEAACGDIWNHYDHH